MASFDGATFLEQNQGDGYPSYGKADLFVTKQAANNTPTLKEIGMDIQKASIAALVTGTELTALYGLVLASGTLAINWESHSALLVEIAQPIRQGMEDLYSTTLSFIRL